jgi:hypothetical protein
VTEKERQRKEKKEGECSPWFFAFKIALSFSLETLSNLSNSLTASGWLQVATHSCISVALFGHLIAASVEF